MIYDEDFNPVLDSPISVSTDFTDATDYNEDATRKVVNLTQELKSPEKWSAETPYLYTAVITLKDSEGNDIPKTVISREYSSEWKLGDEPYYPVNDEKNGALYAEYKKLAEKEENVIFGGRLGEYKYYDMDAVIASALELCEKELGIITG